MRAFPVRGKRLLLGLTGGIGSGKSTAARLLVNAGCELVDADQIARNITQPGGAALIPIAHAFGSHLVDEAGQLDRATLRELVFNNPTARKQLEGITHPLVAHEIASAVAKSRAAVVVLDIPLLVESGRWRHGLDKVVVIDCSTETQRTRIRERNGWPEETISAVIGAQCKRTTRLAAADYVIHNDGVSLAELTAQVHQLAGRLGL